MNLQRFVDQREPEWRRLEELIGRAGNRPERLGGEALLELGTRYRGVVADLSLARQHFPGDPVTARLESLAVSARRLVYDSERRTRSVRTFFATRYWQLIASRPAPLFTAVGLLLVPALLALWWSYLDPASALGLVPAEFRDVLRPGPEGTDQGMSVAEQAAFSGFLISHNTQVAILAFAAGIFFGIGTAYILITNGVLLGAIAGLLFQTGNTEFFFALVAGHGVIELSAIIVAGAAGLRMGWALVDPGLDRRTEAFTREARAGVLIVLGTIPWFVVAGIIEAFASRRGIGAAPLIVLGLAVGALYWGLVVVRGRSRDTVDQTRTLDFASR